MLFEFLPLIDKHNKACQNALALEKCWLAKNCRVQLLTIFLCMAIIDLLWWDRRQSFGHVWDLEFTGDFYDNTDHDFVYDFDVRTMAKFIRKPLSVGLLKYWAGPQTSASTIPSSFPTKPIVCSTGHDGSIIHPKQVEKEGSKIRVRQQSCFICHQ